MNPKILASLAAIALVVAVAGGATVAYFSDTETSTGNTFAAGSLDLTVDNTCYYNGKACVKDATGGLYHWEGTTEVCACTWELSNLDGRVFFNLTDLKPGDNEEDTISLHIDDNPAWGCAKITMDSNDDVTCTEPETEAEGGNCTGGTGGCTDLSKAQCIATSPCVWVDNCAPGPNSGELAKELNFVWWADDGDNVLEEDEAAGINQGRGVMGTFDWMMNETTPYFGDKPNEMLLTLADSRSNFFGDPAGTPLPGGKTIYIGKGFCYGKLTLDPVVGDGGVNPTVDSGFHCDGDAVTNATQSDKITATLEFYIEQARDNDEFLCPEHEQSEPVPAP